MIKDDTGVADQTHTESFGSVFTSLVSTNSATPADNNLRGLKNGHKGPFVLGVFSKRLASVGGGSEDGSALHDC